jgi:hypothetical protein
MNKADERATIPVKILLKCPYTYQETLLEVSVYMRMTVCRTKNARERSTYCRSRRREGISARCDKGSNNIENVFGVNQAVQVRSPHETPCALGNWY